MSDDEIAELRSRVAEERRAQGLEPTVPADSEALAVLAAVARKIEAGDA